MIRYRQYNNADDFLTGAEPLLMDRESVCSLMIGMSLRLREDPFLYSEDAPLYAVVEDEAGVLAAALMTPPYKLQINTGCRRVTDAMEYLAENLFQRRWSIPAILTEREPGLCFGAAWCRLTNQRIIEGMAQRIHELTAVTDPSPVPGVMRIAEPSHLDQVQEWAAAFHRECFNMTPSESDMRRTETAIESNRLVLWMDPDPVSMATRTRPTPHTESVSYVYTPPRLRGKGYASALVAALSKSILDTDKTRVTLYTDLSNPTSNRIYHRLGYRPAADVFDFHFHGV